LAAADESNRGSAIADAAKDYLAALSKHQRARTQFALDSEERTNFHYTPVPRKGLALREMNTAQRHLADALLSTGLSSQGILKAHTIMSLEEVLKVVEKGSGPERDPDKYFVSIFGEPSASGAWGFRFEGHHVSLNYVVVGGHLVSSPTFFGSNPAEVKDGPRAGLRALPREEDLARDFMQSLTPEQRAVAIVQKDAYGEILTAENRKAALNGQPNGIAYAKLTPKQAEALDALVAEYAANLPPEIANARMDQFHKNRANLFFAWAGGINKGEPHYYRIQTPSFLIEYDKTQDHANHIHSVWREFNGDFGLDLLADHYKAAHR
jgi:hypothetical protein